MGGHIPSKLPTPVRCGDKLKFGRVVHILFTENHYETIQISAAQQGDHSCFLENDTHAASAVKEFVENLHRTLKAAAKSGSAKPDHSAQDVPAELAALFHKLIAPAINRAANALLARIDGLPANSSSSQHEKPLSIIDQLLTGRLLPGSDLGIIANARRAGGGAEGVVRRLITPLFNADSRPTAEK